MQRRHFLKTTGAVALTYGSTGIMGETGKSSKLSLLSAHEVRSLLAKRELSALEYAESLLIRIDACAHLNAFISVDGDALTDAARAADARRSKRTELGPLHGIPIGIKDNINTSALPTTGGTAALRHNRPFSNAPVADAVFAAGALLAGKTNMHELAFGVTNNNAT